jgi:hypothetical protein
LERKPEKRLGYNGWEEIQDDPYFKGMDFNLLYNKGYPPPKIDIDEEIEEDSGN